MITKVLLHDLVMPDNCNYYGNAFGGWIMARIDIAASILAKKVAKGLVVTKRVSEIDFESPIPSGATMETEASLDWTKYTSMGITVTVSEEGKECTKAKVVMVAINEDGTPKPLAEDKRDFVVGEEK